MTDKETIAFLELKIKLLEEQLKSKQNTIYVPYPQYPQDYKPWPTYPWYPNDTWWTGGGTTTSETWECNQ